MGVDPTTAEFLHNTALAVQHVPEVCMCVLHAYAY